LITKSVEAFLRIWEQIHFGFVSDWSHLLPHNDSAVKEMMKRRGRRTIDHAQQNSFEFENKFCFVLFWLLLCLFLPHNASAGKEMIKKGREVRRNGLSSSTILVLTIYSIFFPFCQRKVITLCCLESLPQLFCKENLIARIWVTEPTDWLTDWLTAQVVDFLRPLLLFRTLR
jgi:hypothetical protein